MPPRKTTQSTKRNPVATVENISEDTTRTGRSSRSKTRPIESQAIVSAPQHGSKPRKSRSGSGQSNARERAQPNQLRSRAPQPTSSYGKQPVKARKPAPTVPIGRTDQRMPRPQNQRKEPQASVCTDCQLSDFRIRRLKLLLTASAILIFVVLSFRYAKASAADVGKHLAPMLHALSTTTKTTKR